MKRKLIAAIAAAVGIAAGAFASTIDLSGLIGDTVLGDGDVVTGTLNAAADLSLPKLTIADGVAVAGAAGAAVPPVPEFAANGKATTTEFTQGTNGTWTLTAFAELANDAIGADVADDQIKVYAAGTVEGLNNATPLTSGVEVKEKKSAVKTTIEVTPPDPAAPAQFFKVKFGE